MSGALAVEIAAVFARPKSAPRCSSLTPCIAKNGDADNLGKAILDAGNGVLWRDDSQVVRLVVNRWYAPTGEPAMVRMLVERANEAFVP